MKKFSRFLKNESGATAIEYGLIAAAIAGALITVLPLLGSAISGKFTALKTAISN